MITERRGRTISRANCTSNVWFLQTVTATPKPGYAAGDFNIHHVAELDKNAFKPKVIGIYLLFFPVGKRKLIEITRYKQYVSENRFSMGFQSILAKIYYYKLVAYNLPIYLFYFKLSPMGHDPTYIIIFNWLNFTGDFHRGPSSI